MKGNKWKWKKIKIITGKNENDKISENFDFNFVCVLLYSDRKYSSIVRPNFSVKKFKNHMLWENTRVDISICKIFQLFISGRRDRQT